MAGITISLLSNTRDVIRGAKETEGALDNVADALDDLAREGKRTGQELGDGITDGLTDNYIRVYTDDEVTCGEIYQVELLEEYKDGVIFGL